MSNTSNRSLAGFVLAMTVIVASANFLVQFPINDWLTWGALTYPVSYLVTDLANRWYGPAQARRVVLWGFVAAVLVSVWLATPRIALASGLAFLLSQLLDVQVFDRLRRARWWQAPLVSSVLGSLLDTYLFFAVAFAGTSMPWLTLASGDLVVKLLVALAMLAPYGVLLARLRGRGGEA